MLFVCSLRRYLYIYLRLLTTVHFVLSRSPRPQAAKTNFLLTILKDSVNYKMVKRSLVKTFIKTRALLQPLTSKKYLKRLRI